LPKRSPTGYIRRGSRGYSEFIFAHLKKNAELKKEIQNAVIKTVTILQLNSDSLVRLRYAVLKDYSAGDLFINFFDQHYPFVASELKRQGVVESIKGTIP
jgi:hypothetical protein